MWAMLEGHCRNQVFFVIVAPDVSKIMPIAT